MERFRRLNYVQKIRWRLRASWLVLLCMLIYMVAIGELGGGDSRIMTDLADFISRFVFFGGMIYVITRIVHNRKLLRDRLRMKEQMRREQDERNQYLHDKSGGTVLDILLMILLFATVTAALFNMPAFYTAFSLLVVAIVLKTGAYLLYSRGQ